MKYPTSEYRKLLCLYQQLQQPEPVIFSRTLREHHLLFLSNTPTLILYFTRQGKRYWLVNEKAALGLKPFRYPAGKPGHFFIPSLKNTLCVKLHRVLDNNDYAIALFCRAIIRQVSQVFDVLIQRFNQATSTTFSLHRTVTADSTQLASPRYSGVLGHDPKECRVVLALRRCGLGLVTVDMVLHYSPLPFVRYQGTCQVEKTCLGIHLSDEVQTSLKAQLCHQVPDLVAVFFHHL